MSSKRRISERRVAGLLGLAFDAEDGHKRITRGKNFLLAGGSEQTHGRMRETIGRTPKSEILRVQINLVRQLLADTDLTLSAIAHKTGFRHPQYMAEVFKQKLGQTPGEYRAAVRV